VAALALDQSQQEALVIGSFNKVDFPVSIVEPLLHNRRTFFDADTVLYPSTPILAAESVPALLPALAKVLVECAASAVVGINMLVDALMAYRLLSISAHNASDLLRTQVIIQVSFYLRLQ
jgi:hypothetical protein